MLGVSMIPWSLQTLQSAISADELTASEQQIGKRWSVLWRQGSLTEPNNLISCLKLILVLSK